MIVARPPCLPMWWRYHLPTALRHARRSIKLRILFGGRSTGSVSVAGLRVSSRGDAARPDFVPLLELRTVMLDLFAAAFLLRTRHKRLSVGFPTE